METLKRQAKRQMLKDNVRKMIRQEALRPGDRILSQNQLADQYGVNPLTAFKALTELCEEGVLYRENGRGTFVAPRQERGLSFGLMLPGENLCTAERNPDYWPYVQELMRFLLETIGGQGNLSTIVIEAGELKDFSLRRLEGQDLILPFGYSLADRRQLGHRLNAETNICPVFHNPPFEDVTAIYVEHDRRGDFRRSVEHLHALGYRRIGLFCMPESWGDGDIEGYREGLLAVGLPYAERLICRSRDGAVGAAHFLALPERCDALICDTVLRVPELIECLAREGLRVPQDIGLLGYQYISHLSTQAPCVACTSIPYDAMFGWAIQEYNQRGKKLDESLYRGDFPGSFTAGQTLRQS